MTKKILIVEDEKLLGEMYRDKFTEANFGVMWVDTAEEALEALKSFSPDLILLDILLPRDNGIEFLKKLRDDLKTSNLLVVAFSNYDDKEVKAQAMKLGVKDYLLKTDYTPQEIIEKVENYLKEI